MASHPKRIVFDYHDPDSQLAYVLRQDPRGRWVLARYGAHGKGFDLHRYFTSESEARAAVPAGYRERKPAAAPEGAEA